MIKAGILGGGQLGRMLLQCAANYPVETYILENDTQSPAAHLCHRFVKGDINNYEDVYAFGKMVDVLTIEIEHVNLDALEQLEKEGLTIIPKTETLKTIKNKISQKAFYTENLIPTAPYLTTDCKLDLAKHLEFLPAVHKTALGGYDGKGVQIIRSEKDILLGFDSPSILEKMVEVEKEIAVIVAIGQDGETAVYPPVEMVFDADLNLLSHQICPADLSEKIFWSVDAIAVNVIKKLNSPGLFAVELFTDKQGHVLVNEIAPRVHNSGHHTIEGHFSSQYDMLWRILLQLPLGNPDMIMPSALVNVVGESTANGTVMYDGLHEVLKMDNIFVHLYGKRQVKPGRKMGHVTIISREKNELLHRVKQIKHKLRAVSVD
jgi:5-(carboxyamino)imidazole ribonucleotide synthase